MKSPFYIIIYLIGIGFNLLEAGDQNSLSRKVAIAVYTNPAPRIDGRVDRCWHKAHGYSGFIQRTPLQGKEASTETKFYVMYDKRNVYLLFIMLDPHPERIPARLVERDYRFYPDDSINFYLDTYNDQRKAFFFSTNPYGVEQDGLISENGRRVDMSWDGIFRVSARRNKFGWVAEFAIPLKTLRFEDSRKYQVWGFNAWRVRKEKREVSYWSLVDQNYDLFRLDKGGLLILQGIKSGNHLDVIPYSTSSRIDVQGPDSDLETKIGMDVRFGMTSDLIFNLTVNPDFSQVEIDEEQINLDKRFELSLQEKRPFFLESINLFQLPIRTFYSRRIGALSDIQAGVKLTGKNGPYSIGFLGVKTGDISFFRVKRRDGRFYGPGESDLDEDPVDEWFSILRIQRDILSNSNLGIMITDREANPDGQNYEFNRSASLDWNLFLGRHQSFFGQLVTSSKFGKGGEGSAAIARLTHFDQRFWFYLQGYYYSRQFDVDGTGFFPKLADKGHREINLYLETHPFINKRFLRSWGASSEYRITRESEEFHNGYGVQNKVWLEFQDQSRITLSAAFYQDEEDDFLGRFSNLVYNGRDIQLELHTDSGKPVSLKLEASDISQYYFQTHSIGFNRGVNAALLLKPVSNGFVELGFQLRQFLDEKHRFMPRELIGQNNVQIWSLRGRYLFRKGLFSRAFIQLTNGGEEVQFILNEQNQYELRYTVFDRLSANILLGWRYRPGSTIYLVYTEEWNRFSGERLTSVNRTLFFKFSYLWSF